MDEPTEWDDGEDLADIDLEAEDPELYRLLSDPRMWEALPARERADAIDAEIARAIEDADEIVRAPGSSRPLCLVGQRVARTPSLVHALANRVAGLATASPDDALQISALAILIGGDLEVADFPEDRVLHARGVALREHAFIIGFLGRFAEAMTFADRSAAILEQVAFGTYDLALVKLVQARALRTLKRHAEGVDLVREARGIFERSGIGAYATEAKSIEATLLYDDGAVAQALELWSSLQDDPNLSDTGSARLRQNIAICLCDLGRWSEAIAPLRECVRELESHGLLAERSRGLWHLGKALRDTQSHAEAIEMLRLAWKGLIEHELLVDGTLAALDLAEALLVHGEREEVPAICHDAIAHLNSAGLIDPTQPPLAALRLAAATGSVSRKEIRDAYACVGEARGAGQAALTVS